MKAVILAGGPVHLSPALRRLARSAALVIAADSGLRHASALGVAPSLLVGDFDSVAAADLAAFPGLRQERHPTDKDALDLELALARARAAGARHVTLVGALGARFDQSLAAVFVALKACEEGVRVELRDGLRDVYPLIAGEARAFRGAAGRTFSLLAVQDAVVSVAGARYELSREALPFGVGRGVSNVVRGARVAVRVHAGRLLVVLEHGAG